MGQPSRVLMIALLLVLPACESKRPLVTTELGDQLTTESGDELGTYTARAAPQANYDVKVNP